MSSLTDLTGSDEIAAYRAARAGPVLDDHLLVQVLTELLREDARRGIQAAGGRETHDDAHGFYRITLRASILQRRARCRGADDRDQEPEH